MALMVMELKAVSVFSVLVFIQNSRLIRLCESERKKETQRSRGENILFVTYGDVNHKLASVTEQ